MSRTETSPVQAARDDSQREPETRELGRLTGFELTLGQLIDDGIRYRTVFNNHADNADQIALYKMLAARAGL